MIAKYSDLYIRCGYSPNNLKRYCSSVINISCTQILQTGASIDEPIKVYEAFLPLSPAVFNILWALVDGDKHGYGLPELGLVVLLAELRRLANQAALLQHNQIFEGYG